MSYQKQLVLGKGKSHSCFTVSGDGDVEFEYRHSVNLISVRLPGMTVIGTVRTGTYKLVSSHTCE